MYVASVRRLIFSLLFAALPALSQPSAGEPDYYQDAMQALVEGRLDEAGEALKRLAAREPEHAGAWLDLAILQCGLGNAAEAEALFDAIITRFAPPPAILAVIDQQRAGVCRKPSPRVAMRMRLGRGRDSNVNQGASNPNLSFGSGSGLVNLVLAPEFLHQKDDFTALNLEAMSQVDRAGSLAYLQFQSRAYDSLSRYDLSTLLGGVERPFRLGAWELRGAGALGLTRLGSQVYQRQAQAQLQLGLPLALPPAWKLALQGGVTRVQYPTLSHFDSSLWEARVQVNYSSEAGWLQGSIGAAFDDGEAARAGGDRRGSLLSVSGRKRLAGEMFVEGGWVLQDWSGSRPYAPGLIDVLRHQRSQLLRAALFFPLAAQHGLLLEFREVRNRENISLFAYDSRLLQLSWEWQGGF